MLSGWGGNRRSGVALVMRHRHSWYIHLWARGLEKEMRIHKRSTLRLWLIYLPILLHTAGLVPIGLPFRDSRTGFSDYRTYALSLRFLSCVSMHSMQSAILFYIHTLLFVRPSVRPSVCLSVDLSVCLSVCPSVRPSVRPSVMLRYCI